MPTPIERFRDKLKAEGKKLVVNTTDSSANAQGIVFGTFDKTYPVSAIEREREDGVTLVNLSPECRVFLCGAEVTKDVIGVDTSYDDAANGGCTITLSNPRGKYNVDITDLIGEANQGRWREDKDILQAYEYPWLNKQGSPYDNVSTKVERSLKTDLNPSDFSAAFDKIGRNTVESDIINSINSLTNLKINDSMGITRMLYEIKFHSNCPKKAGEIIFDFRDPIYVFFKGRFSSYWYFGFSGVISGLDQSRSYGSDDIITIQGSDPLYIYKRKKYTDKGSLIRAASHESGIKGLANRGQKIESGQPGAFNTLVKVMFFSQDERQYKAIENSHFYYTSANTLAKSNSNPPPYNTSSSSTNLERYMNVFREAHEFKTGVNSNQNYIDGMMCREFTLRSVTSGLLSSLTSITGAGLNLVNAGLNLVDTGLNTVMNPGTMIPIGNTGTIQNLRPFTALTGFDSNSLQNQIDKGLTKFQGKVINTLDSKVQSVYKTTELGGKITEAVAQQIGIESGRQTNFESWFKQDKPYLADPDCFNLGPWNDIYLQYNEITIEDFKEENIKPFYDTSVRYWTKDYSLKDEANLVSKVGSALINEAVSGVDKLTGKAKVGTAASQAINAVSKGYPFNNSIDTTKTGWQSNSGFGVCGIHPALTYDFINNFHRVEDVYNAAINPKTGRPDLLDSIVVTPYERLKEMVLGSPTELSAIDSPAQMGTQKNYFRPRLFFLWPKKFRKRDKDRWTISELLLTEENITSSYDAIEKLTNDEEYCVYCSPMGDIFIEPIMYDFHPSKFMSKIEERDPVYDKKPVYFRNFNNTTDGEKVVYRKDYAYFFNTKANHPLFITQKDTMRVSETIKPEMIRTSVIVEGSSSGGQGMIDATLAGFMRVGRYFTIHKNITDDTKNKEAMNFQPGIYIADGFPNVFRGDDSLENWTKKIKLGNRVDELTSSYNSILLDTLLADRGDNTLYSLIEESGTSAVNFSKQNIKSFAHSDIAAVHQKLQVEYSATTIQQFIIDNAGSPFKDLTVYSWIVLNQVCPNIYKLIQYLSNKDIQSTTVGSSSNTSGTKAISDNLLLFLGKYNIKSTKGLANLSISDIAEVFKIESRAGSSQPVKTSSLETRSVGSVEALLTTELSRAYEICLLSGNGLKSMIIQGMHDNIKDLLPDTAAFPILTRGDLKVLERSGLYNPNTDFVSKYGYNPGPTIINTAIDNGQEAVRFAKTLFNRMTSQATIFSIDLVGRPEFWLNRPYYLEDKYSIGLLTTFSIKYGIEQPFTSSATLSYIRRNSITYSYSLNELDTVASPVLGVMPFARPDTGINLNIGNMQSTLSLPDTTETVNLLNKTAFDSASLTALSPTSRGVSKVTSLSKNKLANNASTLLEDALGSNSHSNSYFNQKALKYYKTLGTLTSSKIPATDEFYNTGSWVGQGVGILGQTIANSVATFLPTITGNPVNGGLYVAHDCIGHLNYNDSVYAAATDNKIVTERSTAENQNLPTIGRKLGDDILTESQSSALELKMIEVNNAFITLQNKEKSLKEQIDIIDKLQQNINKDEEDRDIAYQNLKTSRNNYNSYPEGSSEKLQAGKDKNKYYKEWKTLVEKVTKETNTKNDYDKKLTSALEDYSTFGQTIYNGSVSFDKTTKTRKKPSKPYATDTTSDENEKEQQAKLSSLPLLQQLYLTIPKYSYYNDTTKIRIKWTIRDDTELPQSTSKKKAELTAASGSNLAGVGAVSSGLGSSSLEEQNGSCPSYIIKK